MLSGNKRNQERSTFPRLKQSNNESNFSEARWSYKRRGKSPPRCPFSTVHVPVLRPPQISNPSDRVVLVVT